MFNDNLQIVPYRKSQDIILNRVINRQIVPHNENNLKIVPFRGHNLQIVPKNENDLQILPYIENSPLISNKVINGVEIEIIEGESSLKSGAVRAGKAVGGLLSLWITNACVAETFGATCALVSSVTAAGTIVSGLGVVGFASAAVFTGKMGVDLIRGKSVKQSFEDSASTVKTTTKAVIQMMTNPLKKLGFSNEKPSEAPLLMIEL